MTGGIEKLLYEERQPRIPSQECDQKGHRLSNSKDISIHAFPRKNATMIRFTISPLQIFQSTHSLARMRRVLSDDTATSDLFQSTHSLARMRLSSICKFSAVRTFQSTHSLARMRRSAYKKLLAVMEISIHAFPRKNATLWRSPGLAPGRISIHAFPRKNATFNLTFTGATYLFQSTHSLARMRRNN